MRGTLEGKRNMGVLPQEGWENSPAGRHKARRATRTGMSPSGCLTPPGSFDNPAIDMDLVGLEVKEGWTLAGIETFQVMLIRCQKENPCTPAWLRPALLLS